MASLSESAPNNNSAARCLACGKPLERPLRRVGSLRCLDCRDEKVPLNPELVKQWQKLGAHF